MVENAPGVLSPKVHDHLLALLRPELDAPALVRVVAVVVVAVLLLLLLLAALALALRLLAGLAVVEGVRPNLYNESRFNRRLCCFVTTGEMGTFGATNRHRFRPCPMPTIFSVTKSLVPKGVVTSPPSDLFAPGGSFGE